VGKWIYLGLGTIPVVSGLTTFWLPIPIGRPPILLGLPLLMKHSLDFDRWLEEKGRLYPRIGHLLERLRLGN